MIENMYNFPNSYEGVRRSAVEDERKRHLTVVPPLPSPKRLDSGMDNVPLLSPARKAVVGLLAITTVYAGMHAFTQNPDKPQPGTTSFDTPVVVVTGYSIPDLSPTTIATAHRPQLIGYGDDIPFGTIHINK